MQRRDFLKKVGTTALFGYVSGCSQATVKTAKTKEYTNFVII